MNCKYRSFYLAEAHSLIWFNRVKDLNYVKRS